MSERILFRYACIYLFIYLSKKQIKKNLLLQPNKRPIIVAATFSCSGFPALVRTSKADIF